MDPAVRPSSLIDAAILGRASRVIRVLGHPLRLRLLELLESGERNVTDLVQAAGVSQAQVSQQLGILRGEGIVGDRRDGPRVFYRITEPKVSRILDCIRECDLPDLDGSSPTARGAGLRILTPSSDARSGAPDDQPPIA